MKSELSIELKFVSEYRILYRKPKAIILRPLNTQHLLDVINVSAREPGSTSDHCSDSEVSLRTTLIFDDIST